MCVYVCVYLASRRAAAPALIMSCPSGAQELPCSAYYITRITEKNETNFRWELCFHSPGSSACIFPSVLLYLLHLSFLHLLFFLLFFCIYLSCSLFHLAHILLYELAQLYTFSTQFIMRRLNFPVPSSSSYCWHPHSIHLPCLLSNPSRPMALSLPFFFLLSLSLFLYHPSSSSPPHFGLTSSCSPPLPPPWVFWY